MKNPLRAARWMSCAALCTPAMLSAQEHGLDEIVVTGLPQNRSPGDLGQSITVVRDETLNRVRSANLGETLSGQLGVSSSYFGTGASRPIIRGLGGARVRTLEDGIDSMDAASLSDDHAVSIDPLVADQIEIFRGPTTLLYGSGAVGGVINTVTTRIPEVVPEDGFEGAFELRGDTVASDRAGALRLDGGRDAFAWHFDALTRDSDDYEIPGFAEQGHAEEAGEEDGQEEVAGVVENSALESDAAALGASWIGERSFLGVSVSTFDTLYGVPGHHDEEEVGAVPAEPQEERVRVDLEQTRVDLKGGWSGLAGAIEGINIRIGMNDYEHVELEGAAIGTVFTNEAFEGRVELLHRPFGAWTGALGVQFGDREFAAIGAEAFVPPVDSTAYGIFVVEQLDLDEWQLSFGGRVETQEHKPTNGLESVDDSASSLSFAAVRDLGNDYSLAFNAALAERLPVAEELFSDGPHLATRAIQIGDPTLTEETSTHFDVGIRKTTDADMTWSVTAFVTDYADFIFLQDTGVVDVTDELPLFAFVQQDAEFTGIEAELFMPIAELGAGEIDMRLFTDYVRGELANGEDLPRMPPLRYGARFQYHDERMIAGVEATRYSDQDDVAAFEEPTEGYTMINADFRWQVRTRGDVQLDFFVNGNNLADEEARKHTSFVKDVAPLPGRNYSIGVRSRF